MRLRVLAVGQKMPAWVNEGVQDYTRRMPRDFSVEWLHVPPAKRGTGSAQQHQEQEAKAILSKMGKSGQMVALDVAGREVSTELIAEFWPVADEWRADQFCDRGTRRTAPNDFAACH